MGLSRSHAVVVVGERHGEDSDSDFAIELYVRCAADLANAAFAGLAVIL
jgi:hypothetical protein